MLGTSTHGFKVNFCKFTNETRLSIEDATERSGQTYVAALNGIASGGGYELPLACKEIYLVDDRRSAKVLRQRRGRPLRKPHRPAALPKSRDHRFQHHMLPSTDRARSRTG